MDLIDISTQHKASRSYYQEKYNNKKPNWRPPHVDDFKEQDPELHKSNWENKFNNLVEGNKIKTLPQAAEELEPQILSYITTEVASRKLVGLRRERVLGILTANRIPAEHISRRSFGTWDVLLPCKDLNQDPPPQHHQTTARISREKENSSSLVQRPCSTIS